MTFKQTFFFRQKYDNLTPACYSEEDETHYIICINFLFEGTKYKCELMPVLWILQLSGIYVGFSCISLVVSAGLFIEPLLGTTSNRHGTFLGIVIINNCRKNQAQEYLPEWVRDRTERPQRGLGSFPLYCHKGAKVKKVELDKLAIMVHYSQKKCRV